MTAAQDATLALLTRYYAAFATQDHAGMLDCLTDDVAHHINQGGTETGKAAFAAFLDVMDTAYCERLTDMVLFASEDGTRAAAEFRVLGTYLKTAEGCPEAHGQTYDLPAGAFFNLKNGKIARISVYYNAADWVEQVS